MVAELAWSEAAPDMVPWSAPAAAVRELWRAPVAAMIAELRARGVRAGICNFVTVGFAAMIAELRARGVRPPYPEPPAAPRS